MICRTWPNIPISEDLVFVPTMGALHEGHLSLIREAATRGKPVVVSIFVNPTQFAPNEDFDTYPRGLERDAALAMSAGASVIYAPSAEEIYPHGPEVAAAEFPSENLPLVAYKPKLEDAERPHFFRGVLVVLTRFFDLLKPSEVLMGEKDWQQLQSVIAYCKATPRFGSITITPVITQREINGLAMSSRNAYLSPESECSALGLWNALRAADGSPSVQLGEKKMFATLLKHGLSCEYAVIRDSTTLGPPRPDRPIRALIAAKLTQKNGDIRLIDNAAITLAS